MVAVGLLLGIVSSAQAKYSGGSGEPNDPYQIATAADLIALGETPADYGKHFILTADIDLDPNLPGRKVFDEAVIAPDTDHKKGGFQGSSFTGTFDGNDRTISNFSYSSNGQDYAGLFGIVSAEIRNLVLANPHVAAEDGNCVGALAGAGGQIFNCRVEGGIVTGKDNVGGLVGSADGMVVANCCARVVVLGHKQVGGLVGSAGNSGISNCHAAGSVTGDEQVGGLVGYVPHSDFWAVTDSYSLATVSGKRNVGGLVGSNYTRVINCYSVGRVTGNEQAGGFAGLNEGEITACFWDIETSGTTTSAGGVGKTTAEMQDVSTFAGTGWDFQGEADGPSDIWSAVERGGYPVLWWEVPRSRLSPLPAFSGGTGRPEDPYMISTPADLSRIGHNPRLMAAHFILANDIDLAAVDFCTIGSEGIPFTGVFNGNFKRVLNLTYRSTARGCIGFFGRVKGENAMVKDLRLVDPNIDAGTGDIVASLVGDNWVATIMNCCVEGGRVRSSGTYVGGLAAYSDGSISRSYATCSISGGAKVGGLIGQNDGTITDCYSSSDVSGQDSVGGLAGSANGAITHCYSTGAVAGTGQYVGGLAGSGDGGSCFWDTQTSGQAASGGGVGKTTVEMQTAQTFLDAGWDFVDETTNGTEDIWWIDEGQDYPRLWFQQGRPLLASGPDPRNGSTDVSRSPVLSWVSARPDMQHDVYLGEDRADIASATPASPGMYRGRQPSATTTYAPGNLTWGKTYYWRIDEVNEADPQSPWKGRVWTFTVIDFVVSHNPADGAVDVKQSPVLTWVPGGPGVQYDVYLGETQEGVANATTASEGIYRARLASETTTYTPIGLEWGKTYYWRIDAVDEADPAGVWKGDVWSFTVIDFIVSHNPPDGAADLKQSPVLAWVPGGPGLLYDVYLGETRDDVANATTASQDIYRSRLTSEATTYTPLSLGWGKTYYWRIDAVDEADPASVWKGEVWSFTTAYFATSPYPPDGGLTDELRSLVLTWVAAAPELQRDVYFGEDELAVTDATPASPGIYRGRQAPEQTTYAPGELELGKTYYWRIDGVDPANPGTPSKGSVWRFKAVQFGVAVVVDDFESYTDDLGSRIYETWIDGLITGQSGSTVGNLIRPFAEQKIVHGGKQSMPMDYNNVRAPFYSEAQRTWAAPQNWTVEGAYDLALCFRGKAGNSRNHLYVAIQDSAGKTAVVTHPDPEALVAPRWLQWRIPLTDLQSAGVNTAKVKKMMIGVGDRAPPTADGTGKLYIDDICLMKATP
jgi:hypothetical protein